jgi:hypothetical protein
VAAVILATSKPKGPDLGELSYRVEEMFPSLFKWYDPKPEKKPDTFPYTCHEHEVKGSSPVRYPRICWFGGEVIRPLLPEQQSRSRGMTGR